MQNPSLLVLCVLVSVTLVVSLSYPRSVATRSIGVSTTTSLAPLSSRFRNTRLFFSDNNKDGDAESSSESSDYTLDSNDASNNNGRRGGKSSRRKKYRGEYSKEEFQAVLNKELEDFQKSSLKPSVPTIPGASTPSSSFSSSSGASSSTKSSENPIIKSVKDLFSLVLIADFFVVIVFLGWFVAAAALKDTNPFLLERFQDIFNPVVVPCLTVLMVGSIASGVMGSGKEDK